MVEMYSGMRCFLSWKCFPVKAEQLVRWQKVHLSLEISSFTPLASFLHFMCCISTISTLKYIYIGIVQKYLYVSQGAPGPSCLVPNYIGRNFSGPKTLQVPTVQVPICLALKGDEGNHDWWWWWCCDDIVTQCAFVLGNTPPFTPLVPCSQFSITHFTFPLYRDRNISKFRRIHFKSYKDTVQNLNKYKVHLSLETLLLLPPWCPF